jgi:hypothetical protein
MAIKIVTGKRPYVEGKHVKHEIDSEVISKNPDILNFIVDRERIPDEAVLVKGETSDRNTIEFTWSWFVITFQE